METKSCDKQDFSKMKLSELIKYDGEEYDSDDNEYNLLFNIRDDENYKSPESDNTNSNTNHTLNNEAEETNVQPINVNEDFNNQMLVELKPADDENINQELKTAIESEEDKIRENNNLLVNDHANDCITGKRKRRRTKRYQKILKAKRAKLLLATHVAEENLETLKTDQQYKSSEIANKI